MRLNTPPNYLILPRKLSRGPLRGLKVSQPPPNNTRGGGVADPGTSHELESKAGPAHRAAGPPRQCRRLGRALTPSSHSRRSSRTPLSPPRLACRPWARVPQSPAPMTPLLLARSRALVASPPRNDSPAPAPAPPRAAAPAARARASSRCDCNAMQLKRRIRVPDMTAERETRSRQDRMEPQTLTRHRSLYRTLRLRLARAHRATRAAHTGSSA